MAVELKGISFKNPLDSSPVNWLLANVGDDIIIEHTISVSTFAISSTDAPMTFNNTDGYLDFKNITNGDFSKFNAGDVIMIYNYLYNVNYGYYTITSKPDNSTIFLNIAVGTAPGYSGINPPQNNQATSLVVSIVKPITALYYKWNFIENSEGANFYSKIDGSTQIASITGLDPEGGGTGKPMTMLGAKTYQVGWVEVDEIGVTAYAAYASNFIIRHGTKITPAMLAEQFDDTVAGIAPAFFLNLKCLRSVFYYEARYYVNDPNAPQTLQKENILGNTGWFNENWNTGITNYAIENLNFYETVAGTNNPLPAVKLDAIHKTKFSFDIVNPTDTPFVAGQTKLVLNFMKAPNDEGEYTLNTRDVIHNFVWENALLTVDTIPTAINGENYADSYIKSLANLKAYFLSNGRIRVAGEFEFDQSAIDVFEESDEPRYVFWASIQDHAKTGAISDRVSLLVDINSIYYQTDFPDLIDMDSKLIPHDCPNYVTSFLDREKFTEDELVGFTSAVVNVRKDISEFELTRFTAKILAVNTVTHTEFVLESKTIQIPSNPVLNGFQLFNLSQARPFHIPATEIRKNIVARFGGSSGFYEFAYPFLNRWEYWIAVPGASTAFYNTSEPNNGMNEDWEHYDTGNWKIRYRIELGTKVNGVPAIYSDQIDFKIFDRNLVGENTSCVIDTFDPDTLSPLVDGSGNKYILGYKDTLIRAEFTETTDGFDTNCSIVLGIEVKEEGGVLGKRRMSSLYDSDSDTFFIPLPGQTRVKRTLINAATPPIIDYTKVRGEALLDHSTIQGLLNKPNWKLTARIYGNVQSDSFGTVEYGQNYLGDQYVKMIATNPIDEQTIVLTPEKIDCCSDLVWKVLADVDSSNDLNNDRNTFLWAFNSDAVESAIVSLYNSAGLVTNLTGLNTYGTPYDFGFYTNGSNEKLVGYEIDWRKVLIALGPDTYYVKCGASTIFGSTTIKTSDTYCLKQFTTERANGTVRIEYTNNGLLGLSENDKKFKDLGQLNWYNQHRFDGYFHYEENDYTDDYIQYSNGQQQWVKDEQEPVYTMLIKPIPIYKHDIIRIDILQADDILVTDYNTRNIDNYYQKSVIKASGHKPIWHPMKSKLGAVTLKFKQRFNNLKKYRS